MGMTFHVSWNEDSHATVLGRISALDGTGAATGKKGEGNFLKQADISSITGKMFDLDGGTPDTPTSEFTLDKTVVVLNTPITSDAVWTKDSYGCNFKTTLANTLFPVGGRKYLVEFEVTLSGGTVFHGCYEGVARPIRSS